MRSLGCHWARRDLKVELALEKSSWVTLRSQLFVDVISIAGLAARKLRAWQFVRSPGSLGNFQLARGGARSLRYS